MNEHDVTDVLMEYREAKRHLWNCHFVKLSRGLRDCGMLDHYEAIDRHLFYGLVLERLGKGDYQINVFGEEAIPFLNVTPLRDRSAVPFMLSEEPKETNRAWGNKECSAIKASDAELAFVEFFEWDRYGYVSYQYYRVKILSFPSRPNIVGYEGLIETNHARVLFARTN
jgi:hypothetical protein